MKFKTNKILIFIFLMAIPLKDGFCRNVDETITDAVIFYVSNSKNKVKILTPKISRKTIKSKWELKEPQIEVVNDSGFIICILIITFLDTRMSI